MSFGEGIEVVNEVVRGIPLVYVLMYTLFYVTVQLVASSAEGMRRKFFFAASGRWTSLVHPRGAVRYTELIFEGCPGTRRRSFR